MKARLILFILLATVFLTSCGDSDSGSDANGSTQSETEATLENGKVVYCDSEWDGVIAALADGGFRRCEDGLWVKISASEALKAEEIIGLENVKSSSSQASGAGEKPGDQNEKSSSSVKLPKPAESSSSQKSPEPAESSSSSVDSSSGSTITYGTLIDSRDVRIYKTVKIGDQTWMAENLKYGYNEGSAKSYCYNNSADLCVTYGRLYDWEAAMAACPTGWHLPSRSDWMTLFETVGGSKIAGKMLKSTSDYWRAHKDSSAKGLDAFGFSALPAGYRDRGGVFNFMHDAAYFWFSTEDNYDVAFITFFGYDTVYAYIDRAAKKSGYSVRCLKDSVENGEISSSSSSVNSAITYGSLFDSRDNRTYQTVSIKTQTWMAENLKYDYNEGSAKSFVNSDYPEYGRYYTWAAAMDSAAVFSEAGKGCGYGKVCPPSGTIRGVCPEGYHLPNNNEWETLFEAVGGKEIAGKVLKSDSELWNTSEGNTAEGTNEFGFAVLPAGLRDVGGGFYNAGSYAYFWSSLEYDSGSAYIWNFRYNGEYVGNGRYAKNSAHSVRCVQD